MHTEWLEHLNKGVDPPRPRRQPDRDVIAPHIHHLPAEQLDVLEDGLPMKMRVHKVGVDVVLHFLRSFDVRRRHVSFFKVARLVHIVTRRKEPDM